MQQFSAIDTQGRYASGGMIAQWSLSRSSRGSMVVMADGVEAERAGQAWVADPDFSANECGEEESQSSRLRDDPG